MWYLYTMEYYSAIKRNRIVPFAESWIDLVTVTPSEESQRKTSWINTCMQNLEIGVYIYSVYRFFAKQKQRHRQNKHMDTNVETDIYTLQCMKQITNENLLYSTGNSTQ